ncbi:DNA polymerase I [Candidatus Saccharibacteria bacterium]|nr:DNA polymerase I [Candidatus Saccharibacteria bacterium]
MKRLAIIDGKSVFYRGYYAMPNLSTGDGTPTGGIYGFAALSLELIKKLEPDYVCVAWDKPTTNIRKRLEIYPGYKAGRKAAPPDFYAQIPRLHELLQALSWPLYELDDYEADDIMGSLSRKAEAQGIETCLISSDLDMLQCLAPNTHMYAIKRGFTDIELYKPEYFEQKHGIRVDQFLDLKSLKGDSSDNIPGVPGIGEKGGVKLLQQYDTLDGVYEHIDEIPATTRKKLIEGKDSAYLSRRIASIFFDAPIDLDLKAMDIRDLDTAHLKSMLKELEFNSLLRNLPEHMQHNGTDADDDDTAPLELVEWSDEFATQALMSQAVIIQRIDNELYVSSDEKTMAKAGVKQLEQVIKNVFIVTHDGDALCQLLLQHNVALPTTMYDIRQAGFLINPLKKSRTIAEVTNYDGTDVAMKIAELWRIYHQQSKRLKELPRVKKIAETIDFPLIPILARMEHHGMKLDTELLATMDKDLTQNIATIQAQMFDMVGNEFNISSPSQLADVLYTKLQLPTAGIKRGKTGFSTGQKELDKLRGQHPIIELIEQYRELTKLQNTYVQALPKLVDERSRLHTTFNQDVAATGRLSSTEPNLQNIPIRTEIGRKIREAFVPEPGNVFVSADYSQFELRLAAVLSGDEKMINDFNAGTDIHAKTAADVHHIPLDDVTKKQRREAKVVNFGILYGMGPHALAQNTGMTFGQAKTFIDEYFNVRAKVREYIDATLRQARDQGYVETFYGRRRPTPDVQSSNFVVRQAAERAAANMPIQGTEADLMKRAMIEVEKKLNQSNALGHNFRAASQSSASGAQQIEKNDSLPAESRVSRADNFEVGASAPVDTRAADDAHIEYAQPESLGVQVLQIHDSILVECPAENAEKVSDILRKTMESIAPELKIKLQVDVSVGKNWGEV